MDRLCFQQLQKGGLQHPFPAFFEDCYAAFCWVCDNAGELGIDVEHIGIGGDSAVIR